MRISSKAAHDRRDAGQSILEVVVAMGVFALIAATLMALAIGGLQGLEQGGEQTQAQALAQEGMEAVRSIRDRAWNENTYAMSSVSIMGSEWIFDGEGTTETIGQFTRIITFGDVCRDALNDIGVCPGLYTDAHTKEIKVEVTWQVRPGVTNSVQRIAYVTNWDSREWTQTNWFGGSGQTIWLDSTRYNADNGGLDVSTPGEVKLQATAGSGATLDPGFQFVTDSSVNWPYDIPGNYTYDSSLIDVAGSNAQLKASGGSTVSGDTLNATFDSNDANWTYVDWSQGGGDPDAIGVHQSFGGNPNGYVEVTLPFNLKNKRIGGYWEQSFTTTVSDPNVTCEIDWRAFTSALPSQGVDELFVAVYIDASSGEPLIGTEILRKDFTNVFAWESHSGTNAFDCSSSVSGAGTYYYKIAVWIDATNKNTGPIVVGFDNAKVHWEKTTGGSFSTDKPHIRPTSSYTAPGVQSWDTFVENATKNGVAEIYYQISLDNGAIWQYWTGVSWVDDPDGDEGALEDDYNVASVVNANLASLPTIAEQIVFRAFLVSNGTDLVQLDEIIIGFTPSPSPWSFFTWDVNGGEVTPAGIIRLSGGNPDSYAEIQIPSDARNDLVGGYWEQSILIPQDGIDVDCGFEWSVTEWVAVDGVDDYQLYVFLDSSTGEPAIGKEIWSSGLQSGTTGWSGSESIDCSSSATSTGTYYYKLAAWLDAKNKSTGPIIVGYDNAQASFGTATYVSSAIFTSSAFDMSDASPVQVIEWDEALPICSPACEVKFEVSVAPDDAGSPGVWGSWYGAGGPSTFFATSTGALVSTDLNGSQWMRYRATLTGDGTDTPILEEVRINYK